MLIIIKILIQFTVIIINNRILYILLFYLIIEKF